MQNSLFNFFYPKSVCVVGASSKEKSIGYEILKSIKTYKFTGDIFPVNPKSDEILGYKCFSDISLITEKIDLAFIVVPKRFVLQSVRQLIEKKVKSIVIVTAGFRETGEEGEKQELELLNLAKENGVRLVGPNCMGLINADNSIKLNATFVAEKPEYENVGFLSQSGALGAAVINSLRQTNIKFAHFISVGNKADVNEIDLLEFWEKDKSIKLTTYYLESFVNGFEFINKFMLGKIKKPAIVLKAGKSNAGMKAAASHTGALGTEDRVVNSLLNQFGIIRVQTLNEMFNTVKAFQNFPIPKGRRIAVITNAGGPAILAVDALEKKGLKLAEFSKATIKHLDEIVPNEGSKNNPVDLLPGGNSEMYKLVNEIVLKDRNVDAVISIFVEPVMVEPLGVIEAINSIKSTKPIYQVAMPLPEFWENYKQNSQYKKPIFKNPEEPAEFIANILFHKEKINTRKIKSETYKNQLKKFNKAKIKGNDFLDSENSAKLARKYKLPLPKEIFINPNEKRSLKDFDFPVVLKGLNSQSTHKSDIGSVILNIKNKTELKKAAKTISQNMKSHDLQVEQFHIQSFYKAKFELLIGGFRDSSFGPIITFGLGGKYVNHFEDVALKSAFITDEEILEMINQTRIGKIIQGVRGEKPVNIKRLVKIISNSAKMIRENSNLAEFDINPLIITENGEFIAVDFRAKMI